jgi:hypothetical protein
MNEVEKELQNLYVVARLRTKPEYYETSESTWSLSVPLALQPALECSRRYAYR